ncbi:MAG: AmmeMemoRadiSam system radical SAM enzyme [Candidatus Hermodarchaeota archaeon]
MNLQNPNPCQRPALQYEQLASNKVRCGVCERRCTIAPGNRGMCGARKNLDGKLVVLTYGDISSLSANPIEKKPLFHFNPRSRALTIGSWGCNFACPWCQNWSITKRQANPSQCNHLSPQDYIDEVHRTSCQGTSFSFNEPTTAFFEYALDVMPLAHNAGLYNTFVSNGYMTASTLRRLAEAGLDAMNIDIKGCRTAVRKLCKIDTEKVWNTAQMARDLGIWIEVTTLVIPGFNDSNQCLAQIAHRIHDELGEEVPWHVSAFFPAYKAREYGLNTSTPTSTLERAYSLGKKAELFYVYLGNVPGHPAENSYCRQCNALLIKRRTYDITLVHLDKQGACKKCGSSNHFIFS